MNHDETKNPDGEMQAWIEPELEARVVAWVAGEASAFEIAELERLVAEKPELAIFKRRIEAVHGLVGEAARPDAQPLRLSEERRAKLLATIGGVRPATAEDKIAILPESKRASRWSWRGPQIYFAASGLAAAMLIVVLIAPGQFAGYKQETMVRETAQAQDGKVESQFKPALIQTAGETPAVRDNESRRGDYAPVPRARVAELAEQSTNTAAPESPRTAATDDPIVKLDAFTVTESRDAGYRATAHSAATATTPITVPGLADEAISKDKRSTSVSDASAMAASAPDAAPGQISIFAGGAAGRRVATDLIGQTSPDALSAGLASPASGSAKPRQNAASSEGLLVGRLELGATGARADADQLSRANPFDLNAAQADGKSVAGATGDFADRVSRFGITLGAASPPPASVTFGEPAKKVAAGQAPAGAVGSVVLGAASTSGTLTAANPPREEPMQLYAFSVSPENKGAARAGPDAAAPVAVAKRAGAKEEQEKVTRDLPQRPDSSGGVETAAAREPVSTFSLHVSDVSFRLAVAAVAGLERGVESNLTGVRAEEFYNAFDYGDPAAALNEKISATIEQSAHPVLQQRNLLRIALKVPASGRGAGQPLRLTVLLDTSGSMERDDRRMAVRRALEELIALLGPDDRVTLIGFARQPRLLAENVPGNQAGHLVELSVRTPSEGGTNLEEAVKLASQLALRHKLDTAQNRIVLLTDGAANLGNADPARLTQSVETLRQQGIAFDACGIGLEGVGDVVLEALTRKGDGRYYVVDRPEAADASFARQLAGASRPAAENVKLQVRFNPARVGNYRLVGFEQHRLQEQDFRNDKVDAAELAADEGANAVYQLEVLPQGSGEVGEVFVRFRDPSTGNMIERSWTIRYDPQAPRFDRASASLQLAGVAALVAEKLNQSPLASQFKLGDLAGVVTTIRAHYAHEPRVQELVTMYGRLRRVGGE